MDSSWEAISMGSPGAGKPHTGQYGELTPSRQRGGAGSACPLPTKRSRREGVKKLGGRASWRAVAPANRYPMRLGGSLALPISAGFEFFHTFRLQAVVP